MDASKIEPIPDTLSLERLSVDVLETIFQQLPFGVLCEIRQNSKTLRDAVDRLPKKNTVQQVVHADSSTYFLDSLGRVSACGNNICGQLGLGSGANNFILTPTPINSTPFEGEPVQQIITDGSVTFFLLKNGKVFSCGIKRLGFGCAINQRIPTPIDSTPFEAEPVQQVISGGTSSFFLSQDGQVFACGRNDWGQLGLGDTESRSVPTLIQPDHFGRQALKQVISGGTSSFFLSQDGQLFACGNNKEGQLGVGHNADKIIHTPTPIDSTSFGAEPVQQVITSGASTFFLLKDGSVFACGRNWQGQLGLGDTDHRFVPTRVYHPSSVLVELEAKIQTLMAHKDTLDTLNSAVPPQDKSKTESLGTKVEKILEAHRSEPSLARGLLKSLQAIQEACKDHSTLAAISLPKHARNPDENGVMPVSPDPVLFRAFGAVLAYLDATAKQQGSKKEMSKPRHN